MKLGKKEMNCISCGKYQKELTEIKRNYDKIMKENIILTNKLISKEENLNQKSLSNIFLYSKVKFIPKVILK